MNRRVRVILLCLMGFLMLSEPYAVAMQGVFDTFDTWIVGDQSLQSPWLFRSNPRFIWWACTLSTVLDLTPPLLYLCGMCVHACDRAPVLRDIYPEYPEILQAEGDAIRSKLKLLGYADADLVKVKYIPIDHANAPEWLENAFASDSPFTYPTIVLGPTEKCLELFNPAQASTSPVVWHEAGHLWHGVHAKKCTVGFLAYTGDFFARRALKWSGAVKKLPDDLQGLTLLFGLHDADVNFIALAQLWGSIIRLLMFVKQERANYLAPLAMISSNAYSRYHERLADDFSAQHTPFAQGLLAQAQEYRDAANGCTWYSRALSWLGYYFFDDHTAHLSRAQLFQKAYEKRLPQGKANTI